MLSYSKQSISKKTAQHHKTNGCLQFRCNSHDWKNRYKLNKYITCTHSAQAMNQRYITGTNRPHWGL